ncbi:MAG TPA: hypothetical protein PK625_06195 [Spirochaetales bacterium]|nr:hypothetical protein [Spirochaetales bacterium]
MTILGMFTAAWPAAAQTRLVVDAAVESPSSPRQWVFHGVQAVPGPAGGMDLVLVPGWGNGDAAADLRLSFDGEAPVDEAGNWAVTMSGSYERSSAELARLGEGAGVFRAPSSKLALKPERSVLALPGSQAGDFSMDFWLKPSRAENGEIILIWKASKRSGTSWRSQQYSVLIQKNRLVFGFINFFEDPSGKATTVSLSGRSMLLPARWSHHILRFDSATGLLEYLMDGIPEAVTYVTSTGRQGGEVFPPRAGSAGLLELGANYTGLIDEFRILPSWVENPATRRYQPEGGWAESPIYDLGSTNARILSLEGSAIEPGEGAVHWFYRCADSSAGWRDNDPEWVPFLPGASMDSRGRYIQLRAELYPDAAGERSPSLTQAVIVYEPDDAPSPPAKLLATAGNGSIRVEWSASAEADVRGYVLYYGYASRDYFGDGADQGTSPVVIEGRNVTSFTLTGLENGRLYFLALAAYDGADPPHVGEFSAELYARPSRVSP